MLVIDRSVHTVSFRNLAAAVASGFALVLVMAAPAAAMRCIVDVDGANDDPGQKDVTQFCVGLGDNDPFDVHATASLDLTALDGGNTGDLCLLFDSNADGNINVALCTTVAGSPAAVSDVRVLTCGDSRSDKCTGAVKLNACSGSDSSCSSDADCGAGETCSATFNTACTASQVASDPFAAGDASPMDTVIACAVDLEEFGPEGPAARLINMGAYSSSSLSSDLSDSVLPPLCGSDADCKAGEVCHVASGECYVPEVTGCTDNADCAAGELCEVETGVCVPGGCTSDADCPAGKVCNVEAGVCETPTDTGCTEDADCATGLVCNVATGECEDIGPECTIDTDCPVGQVCNALLGLCEDATGGGSCSTNDDCIETQVCNPVAGLCVDPSDPCTADSDCATGEVCNLASGLCETPEPECTVDADCTNLDGPCGIGACDLETGKCVLQAQNDGGACGEPGTCEDSGICNAGACVTVTACDSACSLCDGGHCLSLCANPHNSLQSGVTVTDALYILRASVSLEQCTLCVCDVNGNESITAVDALSVLRLLVRLPQTIACPGHA
jgi:Cys-rich repeat protein